MSQYGLRLSKELKNMQWKEFIALLRGLSPDTAIGRIVAIRSEKDKEILKYYTPEQHRIRNLWALRKARGKSGKERDYLLDELKRAFIAMSGKGG